MSKQKTVWGLALALLLWNLCCITATSAEAYQFSKSDNNWTTVCDLEAPKSFQGDLYQYKFVRQKIDAGLLQAQFSQLFCSPTEFKKDPENNSFAYSDSALMLSVPTFVSKSASPSVKEQESIDFLTQKLNEIEFHCFPEEYLCATLDTLWTESNESAIGRVYDWVAYIKGICNENQTVVPHAEDLIAVFVPEINSHPVLPQLFGNYSDAETPMFALALIQQDKIGYIEIGHSYDIKKKKKITANTVDWKSAVDTAVVYGEQQWKKAFDAMSAVREAGLDYPIFYRTYQPSFELRTEEIQTCYYASGGVLRPAYQINMTIHVRLQNDEALTTVERHRFLPEVVRFSYVIDAVTGAKVG